MKEWAVFLILRQLLLRDGKYSPARKARETLKTDKVVSRPAAGALLGAPAVVREQPLRTCRMAGNN